MHKTLYILDDVDKLYMSRKESREGLYSIQGSVDASMQWQEDYIKKVRISLIAVTKKQYWQNKHQRNRNNQNTTMEKNPNVRTFQGTNQRNLSQENLDMTKKGKSPERNWISADSSTKS